MSDVAVHESGVIHAAPPPPASPPAKRDTRWKPGVSPNPAGKPKGTQNRVTATIKEAIEKACAPGACHPEGLAGWLVERAQGGVQDRQIFAGLVAKALPAQLQASVQHGGVVVQLGWLAGRSVGRNGTPTTQSDVIDVQAIDAQGSTHADLRVGHTMPTHQGDKEGGGGSLDAPAQTPHPPSNPAAGGVEG